MDSIILASNSPRRRDILTNLNIPFIVFGVKVEERIKNKRNIKCSVIDNAKRKAKAACEHFSSGLVLGADTVVFFNGRVLGKPGNRDEAYRFLRMLSGNRHDVYSGLTVYDAAQKRGYSSCSTTEVYFTKIGERELREYVESGEWIGKAGGYAVQGRASLFIEKIVGSFFNVMGLPVEELYRILKRFEYFENPGRYMPVRRN